MIVCTTVGDRFAKRKSRLSLGLVMAVRAFATQFCADGEACSRRYRRQRGTKMTANAPLTHKQRTKRA